MDCPNLRYYPINTRRGGITPENISRSLSHKRLVKGTFQLQVTTSENLFGKVVSLPPHMIFPRYKHHQQRPRRTVPWLMRLVAGLSLRRPKFCPRPVHVGFVGLQHGNKFISEYFGSPLSLSLHQCSTFIHHRRYVILEAHSVMNKHT